VTVISVVIGDTKTDNSVISVIGVIGVTTVISVTVSLVSQLS
jgi:hypothetical protein